LVVSRREAQVAAIIRPVVAVDIVVITYYLMCSTSVVVWLSRKISSDVRAGSLRKVGAPVPVALVVSTPVWTGVRVVETFRGCRVVESTDVRAGDGCFAAGPKVEARAVSVVRISAAFGLVVVAVTAAEQAVHLCAYLGSVVCHHSPGVALPVDDISAAVVLVVIACPVFVVSSDVTACAASQIRKTTRVALAVVGRVLRTV